MGRTSTIPTFALMVLASGLTPRKKAITRIGAFWLYVGIDAIASGTSKADRTFFSVG
jgi:hypothetical protein